MIIGCPKEIKAYENRVALIPAAVKALVANGARVLVEEGAGLGSNIKDQDYHQAGANMIKSKEELWQRSDIVTKVKEPLEPEWKFFREGQTLYTFLHLAAEPALTDALLAKKVVGIAYETIEAGGQLPLLKPMSEVAGRMAVQVGAMCLENLNGGKGMLLGGVPGVRKGKVIILGAGVVGKNAAKVALGMGAQVTMLDINAARLEEMDDLFLGKVATLFANDHTIRSSMREADLVIGAVLIAGARAPHLVTRDMLREMDRGSVIVDVAVDQGGCIETMHRTTHDKPTYIEEGIVHYGVANMPGAVAMTSTYALSQATFSYLKLMAEIGVMPAIKSNSALRKGLNTLNGEVTQEAVAKALGKRYQNPSDV